MGSSFSPSSYPIVLLLFAATTLLPFLSSADKAFLEANCRKTVDNAICMECMFQQQGSETTNLNGMAYISTNCGSDIANYLVKRLATLATNAEVPALKKAYENCGKDFTLATALLEQTRQYLIEFKYVKATAEVKAVSDLTAYCRGALEEAGGLDPVRPSIDGDLQNISKMSKIATTLIDLASHS